MATKNHLAKTASSNNHVLDVSEVSKSSEVASISGVVTSVSPMRKSKNTSSFFDGNITDGHSSMRIFGFDSRVRKRLMEFEKSVSPVTLDNCKVKRSRINDTQLEVYVSPQTSISQSPKQYTIDVDTIIDHSIGKVTALKDIADLDIYERVTVVGKISEVDEVVETKTGKEKQDAVIVDETGRATCTMWEDQVGKLEIGNSYKLKGMSIREYNGQKYLSSSFGATLIEPVTDIGHVNAVDDGTGTLLSDTLKDAKIVAVPTLEECKKCMHCSHKLVVATQALVDDDSDEFIECSKCQTLQIQRLCESSFAATLMISAPALDDLITLSAYGNTLKQLCSPATQVSRYTLLRSARVDLTFKDGQIRSCKFI